jgi:hypothetical protein
MTPYDRAAADLSAALRSLQRVLSRATAEGAGDDDPSPAGPAAALGGRRSYPGRRMWRAPRPRTALGLEHASLPWGQIEYRGAGRVMRIA